MSAPVITTQPADVTAASGASVTLSVVATGAAGYQWYRIANDTSHSNNILGATGATLTLLVSPATVGLYACSLVSADNLNVSTRIAVVLLTGMSLPVITSQPASQTAAAGATVTFAVTATSATTATYEWYYMGSPIGGAGVSGQNSPTLTITGVTHSTAAWFQCVITNASGAVITNPAGLTVTAGGITYPPTGYQQTGGIILIIPPTVSGGGGAGSGTVIVAGTPGGGWTFNGQSAAALGIGSVKRTRQSRAADTLTFVVAGRAVDADPLFAYGTTVTVVHGTTVFFVGTVTQTPATGSGAGEEQSYTLSGPWWYLMHMVAQQEWTTNAAGVVATTYSGRIILGQALNGTRQTTGATITALLQYAIDNAAPLQIGTIDPAIYAPLDEVKSVTVANAIGTVLRWHPDCVTWFDYSITPPVLHIRGKGNLPQVAFTLGTPPLSGVSGITARHDLQVPAVVLLYEQTGSHNGSPTFAIIPDAAPPSATGRELNALCVTIPLRGESSTTVQQRVETRGIRDSLDTYTSDEIRDFLLDYNAEFQAIANDPSITASGITITSVQRGISSQNPTVYDPTSGNMVADDYDASLNNMLVGGGITDWMTKNDAIRVQDHTIYFSFTAQRGDGTTSAGTQTLNGTLNLKATNAGTNTDDVVTNSYSNQTSYNPGDTVPTGLAATCFAAFNVLHYSGSVTLIEAEASGTAGMGNALNLLGGAGAWQSMAAMISSEQVDVDRGTTTLTFGPPEHLNPTELAELLRLGLNTVDGRTGSPSALATGMSDVRAGNL